MTGSDSADDSVDNLKLVAFSLHFCILQAIKNWRCRRPGNEARNYLLRVINWETLSSTELLQPLESAIQTQFIPAIMGQASPREQV